MTEKTILICSDNLFSEITGGAARCACELAKELANRNRKIIMLIRGLDKNGDFEIVEKYNVYRYKKNIFKLFSELKRIFKNNDVEIVNFHDPYTSLWVWLYMTFNFIKIPIVYTFQSPWGKEYGIRAAKRKYRKNRVFFGVAIRRMTEKFLVKNSNKVVSASRFMSDILFKTHRVKSNIIALGVDISRFKPVKLGEREMIRKKYDIDIRKKVFFTLRNLEPRMGLENLIEAAKILKDKKIEDLIFIIGGFGSMESELKKKVENLKMEDIVGFAGHIPDDELPDYYKMADAFILPTKELEGFGLVTLEAMASGVPVLATPIGANVEVVGGFDKTLLFKSANAEDMADGIISFLKRKNLAELSLECSKYVAKNYSWTKYADEMGKIFYEV